MRKFHSHVFGVDQGRENLFSDFEDGGVMWAEKGSRESRTPVTFSEPFKEPPMIHVSMDMWDMDQKTNQRADLTAENVAKTGFDLVFKTWGDTKVARVRASWLAVGEVKSDEEWDIL